MLTPEELHAIIERIRNGTASAEDEDALRRSLRLTGDVLQFAPQSGQPNINIGQVMGREIQIGDRPKAKAFAKEVGGEVGEP